MASAIALAKPIRVGISDLGPWSLVTSAVIRRAVIVAAILGSALTVANQPQAIMGRTGFDLLPLVLVYLTPFIVVTLSQVLGKRRALNDISRLDDISRNGHGSTGERLLTTVLSHGIPGRALMTSLVIGTVNTLIVLAVTVAQTGEPTSAPFGLIAQVYSLPLLFGAMSQAAAFRRTIRSCDYSVASTSRIRMDVKPALMN